MEPMMVGRVVVAGEVRGQVLASLEPISFWGGYDQATGEIIDRRHPLTGQMAAGKILAIPYTRGSSTTTAVLLESVKAGKSPAAILTSGVDRFLALASIVADEMYARPIPILALEPGDFLKLHSGQVLRITLDGRIFFIDPDNRWKD